MHLIVVGCGRVGAELAFRLFEKGHEVVIIDQEDEAFLNLDPKFRGRTLQGDPLDQDILLRAGIDKADGIAAVSNFDSLNAVVGHVAREIYNVPSVVVRNYDPRWRSVIETFNLQIVGSSSWGAQRVEELLYQTEVRSVFSAGNGEVEVYEMRVPTAWKGHTVGDIFPHAGCIPVAITRSGRALLPDPELVLEEEDIVNISATLEGIQTLRQRLTTAQEA